MCGPLALAFSWLFDLADQDARFVCFLGCEGGQGVPRAGRPEP